MLIILLPPSSLRRLCDPSFTTNKLCTCESYNRNSNAFSHDNDGRQLYPHMRKFYNEDTDLLEHVHIVMSTVKPESLSHDRGDDDDEEETLAQRRRRRTRVSKQRAKVLITEYCTKKIGENFKRHTNKRNHLPLSSSLFHPASDPSPLISCRDS